MSKYGVLSRRSAFWINSTISKTQTTCQSSSYSSKRWRKLFILFIILSIFCHFILGCTNIFDRSHLWSSFGSSLRCWFQNKLWFTHLLSCYQWSGCCGHVCWSLGYQSLISKHFRFILWHLWTPQGITIVTVQLNWLIQLCSSSIPLLSRIWSFGRVMMDHTMCGWKTGMIYEWSLFLVATMKIFTRPQTNPPFEVIGELTANFMQKSKKYIPLSLF